MITIHLDPNAPNTNFILGAALSGGDPIAAAKMLLTSNEPEEEEDDGDRTGQDYDPETDDLDPMPANGSGPDWEPSDDDDPYDIDNDNHERD